MSNSNDEKEKQLELLRIKIKELKPLDWRCMHRGKWVRDESTHEANFLKWKIENEDVYFQESDTEENQWIKIENETITEMFEYLQNRGNDVFLASKTGSILHISTNLIFESKESYSNFFEYLHIKKIKKKALNKSEDNTSDKLTTTTNEVSETKPAHKEIVSEPSKSNPFESLTKDFIFVGSRKSSCLDISQLVIRLIIFLAQVIGLIVIAFLYNEECVDCAKKFTDVDRMPFIILTGLFALFTLLVLIKELESLNTNKKNSIRTLVLIEFLIDWLWIGYFFTWFFTKSKWIQLYDILAGLYQSNNLADPALIILGTTLEFFAVILALVAFILNLVRIVSRKIAKRVFCCSELNLY